MSARLTADAVRDRIRRECERAGGQHKWAAEVGVSPQFVTDILKGRRDPGPTVLAHMGLKRVVTFEPI